MSVWIQNARMALVNKPVLLLHGNVRDVYIDRDGRVYDNLTALLTELAREARSSRFTDLMFYDPTGKLQDVPLAPSTSRTRVRRPDVSMDGELTATAPQAGIASEDVPPSRILAGWRQELASGERNRIAVLFYLDKLVSYRSSYAPEEKKALLWLEKIIENITPNNRLVMVALQDTLIPVELYTHSPKCRVLAVPAPDKEDRARYLRHRLGAHEHGELLADLTDGLSLREVDHIAADVRGADRLDSREVRRFVNRYRIGEQQDYWGSLDIETLNGAVRWFTQTEGVEGQDEAVARVVQKLILARAGLSGMASGTTAKPKAVLFFAGPTGVGKTFVAKKLAKLLFHSEEAFVRFDMSEFKEEHTVSKLIGSPPGYVGFEQGGMLTNAVRERPFSVVLFDELEKAHPRILDLYLQLLDEGRLTDSRGQTIFFTETVLIFTSNLGCRSIDSRGNPALVGDTGLTEEQFISQIRENPRLTEAERRDKIRHHFLRAVKQYFVLEISRPELLNRIGGNIIPFNYIQGEDVQLAIARKHLRRIEKDFADKFRRAEYRLTADDAVVEHLLTRQGERMKLMGGRGITNALEDEVLTPVAPAVLAAELEGLRSVTFQVRMRDGEIEIAAD